ncbi:S8 family serine peptidase [Actinoplanes sp. NPDC049548]|uniref:S8 family serine peptidase n=1 Tax=Actinoplanes sp. NPDC049548 TaxID=3155152 RepID=UPI0034232778
MKAAEAHEITRGDGVTVALMDSGVDADHPDLADAVLRGTDVLDSGDDGRSDVNGHGTAMAGVIAGRGHGRGHQNGILGIAPGAKILPVRITGDAQASGTEVADALAFARAHGARVANMSFGGADDSTVHDAIKAALADDMVLVASSGNRDEAGGQYPGRYPEVLTVGAVDRAGKIADLSVTGPQVDLVAPGVDIATTGITDSGYYQSSGTSHAAAVVSGAAALVRAKFPDLSAAEVVHRLTATATDAGAPGRDDTYGYGRLNLVKALTADVPPLADAPASARADAPVGVAPRKPVKRVSPLVFAGGAAVVVLLIGGLLVGLMLRRRR